MAKFSGSFELKEPPPWQNCCYCGSPTSTSSSAASSTPATLNLRQQQLQKQSIQQSQQLLFFKTPADFVRHLRQHHCTVEGGSYVCHYGYNGVCASLPLDGVSDRDYEMHVNRCHVNQQQKESQIKWSVFSAAQNLPAVLNDPSRSKQTHFFTKKWGDAFVEHQSIGTSPQLPDIKWDHFDFYLKRIGKRYRVHNRIAKTALPSSSSQNPAHQNQQPVVSDRLPNGAIANLKDIPEVFLKHNLELHSTASFAAVFPGIGNDGEQAKQSSRLLQEKLSHYLDIVEVLISKQVAEKSSAFFHAMTSQDAIMEQMGEAATHVSRLRSRLKLIDDTIVRESFQTIHLERIRSNQNIVLERLKLMSTVHQTQPMIQLLLSTQDYVAALDLISTTQDILSQELVGIHCFRHLPSQLSEMERLIDKMLTTDFERYSTADLNRPFASGNRTTEKVLEEDKLICIISGLLRKGNVDFIDTYKQEAITTVRAIIKQMVIEVIASGDAEICLTGAGEEAQSLSLSEWIVLLETATGTLLKLLKRVRSVYDVMQQTADASAGKITDDVSFIDTEAFLSTEDYEVVKTKLANLLQSVCNYCHERCANLVSNQSLEKSSVSAEQIAKLTEIVDRFSDGCEEVCGIQSVPLKLALRAQGTRYAQKFHSERKSKMALLLDSERWKQAEVPSEFQKMAQSISKGDFLWNNKSKEVNGTPISSPPPQGVLLVDGQPFALVGAALLLVQIVSEYCRCASQLPVIASQLARNVIDLLRTFNSRSCQLVLGAGALHVAGLKTITSGNLALVSRALQLVLWLLPHVKRHFQSLEPNGTSSGSTTILTGYDSIEKDFASHIKEIENKVLVIVCDLVTNQLANWDARPPIPSQPFRNISRQFVKLHEAIAPVLPEKQVATIYRVVHKNFKDKLREQLLRNNITNNGGPQHGTVVSELTFYMETLRTLRVMPAEELLDETLDDIWLK